MLGIPLSLSHALDHPVLFLVAGPIGTVGLPAAPLVASVGVSSGGVTATIQRQPSVDLNAKGLILIQNSASLNTARLTESGANGPNGFTTQLPAEREEQGQGPANAPIQSQCTGVKNATVTTAKLSPLNFPLVPSTVDGLDGLHGVIHQLHVGMAVFR